MTTPTTYALDRGASPNGYSALMRRAECPRAATMAAKDALLAVPTPITAKALGVGLMVHKLLEEDARGRPCAIDSRFTAGGQDLDPEWVEEAWRLFHAYKLAPGKYPLGHTLAVEYPIAPDEVTPPALVDLFGHPLTGYIDRVLMAPVDTNVLADIQRTRGLALEPGGVYIQDYKTEYRNDGAAMIQRHMMSLQYQLYMVAWNVLNPERPCSGAVVDCIIKTKQPSVVSIQIPAPTERDVLRTVGWVRATMEAYERDKNQPNAAACVNKYGRLCSYWGTQCEGY